MKTWLKTVVGLTVAMQAGVAWAGESPWTLRLGLSYRDFDDVAFQNVDFRNGGRNNIVGGPAGVQNVTTLPGSMTDVSVVLDEVRWNGGSEGVDGSDKFAPVIGFGYDLMQSGRIRLALVGNFQYYRLRMEGSSASGATGAPGSFTLKPYQHWWWDLDNSGTGETLSAGQPYTGTPFTTTSFSVRNRFDMDVYVLDLGLEARATVSRLNVILALGPTLTIADAESSQRQSASWDAQGLPESPSVPAGSYSQGSSESNTDVLPGAYVALGLSVDLSAAWSIALQYRYDYVSGDAGTSQAELDLSGSSGILSVSYRF
jgi:opacity protein-like surface antigen